MTEQLEKAFARASQLPAEEQDALAEWLLAELASEERWQRTFDYSAERLAGLAQEALREHRAGRTQELDPERL
jgi:hypothetical protein